MSSETIERSSDTAYDAASAVVAAADGVAGDQAAAVLTPPTVQAPPTPVSERPSFVYALGRIEPRIPSLAIEKELAQAIGAEGAAGLTDRQAVLRVLSDRRNRYLARSLCWVLSIEGLDTYILLPRDPADIELLVESYRDEPRRDDLDAVIGVLKGIAPPGMCNGMALPIVVFDLVYSFDREALIESIPTPDGVGEDDVARFRTAAGELFDQLVQLADNAGSTDEHRAINYLTVRYPRLYAAVAAQYERNFAFVGVEVQPSRLSGVRTLMDVVFSFRHRQTDVVERQYVRVDTTEEYPFLATKLGPYFEH